jgi:hypothetical protein
MILKQLPLLWALPQDQKGMALPQPRKARSRSENETEFRLENTGGTTADWGQFSFPHARSFRTPLFCSWRPTSRPTPHDSSTYSAPHYSPEPPHGPSPNQSRYPAKRKRWAHAHGTAERKFKMRIILGPQWGPQEPNLPYFQSVSSQ